MSKVDIKLVNDFFKSIVTSDKRIFVPEDNSNKKYVAIKIEDVFTEWNKFIDIYKKQGDKDDK